jgi:hypothetical protein
MLTLVPVQILVALGVIVTEAVVDVVTLICILFDVAVVGFAQPALEVTTQVIASLLANVVLVYVAEVAPEIFTPPFFHW